MACKSQEQCYLSLSCPWSSFLITEERPRNCCVMRVWISDRMGVDQTPPSCSPSVRKQNIPVLRGGESRLKPAHYFRLDHWLTWAPVPVALSSTHATFLAQTGLKTDMYVTKLQCRIAFTSSNKNWVPLQIVHTKLKKRDKNVHNEAARGMLIFYIPKPDSWP